ncbi:hypothetical protein F5X99DRAFT_427086 [Biscogniauxia marginata]|nr:hypothetical protein F5X99DRAFT_427086 [Biscogniauxia marginata]
MTIIFFVRLWLVILRLVCPSLAALSRCYYPDGDISPDFPCNADEESSACCGGSYGTVCLSNNLCQSSDGGIIRGSCSDQYWGAAACAHYCLGSSSGGVNLISCSNVTDDDTSFCCDGNELCCDTGDGVFSVAPHNPTTVAIWHTRSSRFVVLDAISTSAPATSSGPPTSSSIQTTQATQTSSQLPTVSTSSGDSSDLSTGARAGIGVGAGIAGVIIIALVYALWRLRKTRGIRSRYGATGQQESPASHNMMATNNMAGPLSSHPKRQPESSELYGHQYHPPQELPAHFG